MRFSLRTLLLLFPALIVSYGLASWFVELNVVGQRARPQFKWQHDANSLRDLQGAVNMRVPENERVDLQPVFNIYFNGKPGTLSPDNFALLAGMELGGRIDSWGNPYCCVLIKNRLHFYSCGQDGVSQSDGNDPDDLNSWSESSGKFYLAQQAVSEQKIMRIESLYLMPVTFALVVGTWVFVKRLFTLSSYQIA